MKLSYNNWWTKILFRIYNIRPERMEIGKDDTVYWRGNKPFKDLCSWFWNSFFVVILLPITWLGIFVRISHDPYTSARLSYWANLGFTIIANSLLLLTIGLGQLVVAENGMMVPEFFIVKALWYLSIGLGTILIFLTIAAILVGIIYLGILLWEHRPELLRRKYKEYKEPSPIAQAIKDYKSKHCTLITWE